MVKVAGKSFETLAAELGKTYNGDTALWYGPADTARLIRARLKEEFPGAKFKVNTDVYSGGSSIRIYALTEMSQEDSYKAARLCESFAAGDFDGMTDGYNYRHNTYNGRTVHYMASYIFYSDHNGRHVPY